MPARTGRGILGHRGLFDWRSNPTNEISERRQLCMARLERLGIRLQAHHGPSTRRSELAGVHLAEVVAMWFSVRCQRAQHSG